MTAAPPQAVREGHGPGHPCRTAGPSRRKLPRLWAFAQESSSHLTGQVLCVDGGMAI